jgi:hypothetical protein
MWLVVSVTPVSCGLPLLLNWDCKTHFLINYLKGIKDFSLSVILLDSPGRLRWLVPADERRAIGGTEIAKSTNMRLSSTSIAPSST